MSGKLIVGGVAFLFALSWWIQFFALRLSYAGKLLSALPDFLAISGLVFFLSGVGGTLGGNARILLRLRKVNDLNMLRKEVLELGAYAGAVAIGIALIGLREIMLSYFR